MNYTRIANINKIEFTYIFTIKVKKIQFKK